MSFFPGDLFLGLQTEQHVIAESGPAAPVVGQAVNKFAGITSMNAGLVNYTSVGYAVGDMIIIAIETANQDITVPAHWNQVASSPQGTGTAGAADASRLYVYYFFVTQGNVDNVVTSAGDHMVGTAVYVRGHDPVTPINATAGSVDTIADTSIEYPSVTTTVDKCAVLLIAGRALPDSNTNESASGYTNANLIGLTEVSEGNSAANNGGGVSIAWGVMETAGVVGPSTATLLTAAKKGIITLAIAPIQ